MIVKVTGLQSRPQSIGHVVNKPSSPLLLSNPASLLRCILVSPLATCVNMVMVMGPHAAGPVLASASLPKWQ